MRFTLDRHPTANVITSVYPESVRIGEREFSSSLIVSAAALLPDWPVHHARDISVETLAAAIELGPEIMLLGTGARICFPPVTLFAALAARGIGLEVMDTAAACRTYNILVNEDRPVVAALVLP